MLGGCLVEAGKMIWGERDRSLSCLRMQRLISSHPPVPSVLREKEVTSYARDRIIAD